MDATTPAPRSRSRLTLVKAGDKNVSAYGWKQVLVEEHLAEHLSRLSDRWCTVECLARTMYRRNTPKNCAAVRKALPRAFREMVRQGRFLVIEYAPNSGKTHGEAIAVKIHNREQGDEQERCATEHQLAKMLRRGQISVDLVATARALLV